MKIVGFTDSHGSSSAISKVEKLAVKNKADMILCCGDLTIFGREAEPALKTLSKIGIPILIIHGNHEEDSKLKKTCERYKNVFFIHKSSMLIGNVLILGYGGGGFSHTDKNFVGISKLFKRSIDDKKKRMPNLKVVLMTHAPPYGTKLDDLMEDHCGNKDIANFIREAKLDLALCGHIHENEGREDKIGITKVANPGPFGKLFII